MSNSISQEEGCQVQKRRVSLLSKPKPCWGEGIVLSLLGILFFYFIYLRIANAIKSVDTVSGGFLSITVIILFLIASFFFYRAWIAFSGKQTGICPYCENPISVRFNAKDFTCPKCNRKGLKSEDQLKEQFLSERTKDLTTTEAKEKFHIDDDARIYSGCFFSLAFDNANQNLDIYTDTACQYHPYKNIYDYSITVKTGKRSMVKRAIVGGVLAGDAGAVIGVLTAKDKPDTIQIEIFFDNPSSSTGLLTFYDKNRLEEVRTVNTVLEDIRVIESRLKHIISNNIKGKVTSQSSTVNTTNPVDRMNNLKALYESGMITGEEFDKKRKEILSSL